MQPASYILFDSCATDNPQTAKSASSCQIRRAAFHFAEGKCQLRLAQKACGLGYNAWATLEALASVSHYLLTQLEQEL